MTTDHQHTVIFYDCRPMKAGCHHVLDQVERGEVSSTEATEQLRALAASLPDLDPAEFTQIMGKLLDHNNVVRARRLVDALGDQTLKAWVRPTLLGGWLIVKWGVILAVVAFVARWAVGL